MTAALQERATKQYTQPDLRLGQVVYFYHGGNKDSEPFAAFVVQIHNRSLALNILMPGFANFMTLEGVKHIEDPDVKESEFIDMGGWAEVPAADYQVVSNIPPSVQARLDELEAKVKMLTAQVQQKAKL